KSSNGLNPQDNFKEPTYLATRVLPMLGTHSTYPKVAVQWLNQALCFYQALCSVDSEVLRNRHLRVAAKRCVLLMCA
ncbi:MAG: hypothetical protein KBF73_12650, partial [Flavobacteriales bacterium]|nr:hypothetical protein [Flavobacteriales bacterium]